MNLDQRLNITKEIRYKKTYVVMFDFPILTALGAVWMPQRTEYHKALCILFLIENTRLKS